MTDWREVDAEWRENGTFTGNNSKGVSVQMGSAEGKPGFTPMELLLVSLAGCTGMDIADIMLKKRQPLNALKVKVRGLRAMDFPKVYKEIEVTYLAWGDGIKPSALEQAIALSEEKYCSVSLMLGAVAQIHTSYHILSPGEPEPSLM